MKKILTQTVHRLVAAMLCVILCMTSLFLRGQVSVKAVNETNNDIYEFNGHSYVLFSQRMTWHAAKQFCEDCSGHLVTITSQDETDFLISVFGANLEGCLIGLTDEETEGVWKWVTGEEYNYSNWRSGEPNNQGNEDYVLINAVGTWNDGHLERENWKFICEWDSIIHSWYFDSDNTALACRTCDESYPLSPNLGFKYGKDNFSFEHTDIGSSAISFEGSKYMSGLLKLDVIAYIVDASSKYKNYNNNKKDEKKKQYGNWGGSCYGVASMISDFYSRLSPQKYGKDNVFELGISSADNLVINNDTRLKDSINIMMYSQLSSTQIFDPSFYSTPGSSKINKQLVDTAKSLSLGAYTPIVKYNNHAVNLIGKLTDNFDENYYVIAIYDCNYIGEARFILVEKDYKHAYLGELKEGEGETPTINFTTDKNGNREEIAINNIIKSSFMNNIDFWAPGLSSSPFYSASNYFLTKYKANQMAIRNESEDISQNYVRFLLASDGALTVRGNDGTYFKYTNGSVTETNIDEIYSESFESDFGFYGVYIPYSTDKYEIYSDEQYSANVTYDGNISISYCEKGGLSTVDLNGVVAVDTEKTNSYYEMAAFKYDIIKDSNVLATAISGTSSKSSINCSKDYPEIASDDFEGINVSVQRDDSDFSVETVMFESDVSTKTIKLKDSSETGKIEVDYRNDNKIVKSVSINDLSLNYKSSATITPQITADEGASYTVTYTSSNPSIVSVDNNGNVTSMKQSGFGTGEAIITCTVTDSNGNVVQDTCKVTVRLTTIQWLIKIVLFGWLWY